MDRISVVVPTLNRPNALGRALSSVVRQELSGDLTVEIIVVDNSPDGNAKALVDSCVSRSDRQIVYVHEPEPGVASARNRGVRVASGRWIAFLDDDEEADSGWLSELVRIARATNADAVFGPVEARSDGKVSIGGLGRYFSREIMRLDGSDITDLVAYLGTNNSFFDRATCLSENAPFDESLNTTGGEDSLLLSQLAQQDRRFAWASAARVIEWVPDRRLTWNYVRKRKFLSGQIRVFVVHKLRPVRWARIAGWMVVGLVQFVGAGAAMFLLGPLDKARSARASVICYAGLGKVLWMPKFRPALYGRGLVS